MMETNMEDDFDREVAAIHRRALVASLSGPLKVIIVIGAFLLGRWTA